MKGLVKKSKSSEELDLELVSLKKSDTQLAVDSSYLALTLLLLEFVTEVLREKLEHPPL